MNLARPIHIAGGGLSGLTLGIGLRQKGVPVTIFESGHYPRQRVCGEFISGRGQEVLARLGLLPLLLEWKPRLAQTAAFFTPRYGSPPRPLPQPAICLERYLLDDLLAKKFRALGGDLREGQRRQERPLPPGVVCATGRQVQPVDRGWRWFGLKAHFQNLPLTADLEIHAVDSGYVGLCRLDDQRVNVCGLFRRRAEETHPPQNWLERLRGAPGSLLHQRISSASVQTETFCAVAGLSVRPRRASAGGECRIGDALTMIAPLSGNGMSLAFESAELAIPLMEAYSADQLSWAQVQARLAQECEHAFHRRLWWAWQLQCILFQYALPNLLVRLISNSDWLWRKLFENTRA